MLRKVGYVNRQIDGWTDLLYCININIAVLTRDKKK